ESEVSAGVSEATVSGAAGVVAALGAAASGAVVAPWVAEPGTVRAESLAPPTPLPGAASAIRRVPGVVGPVVLRSMPTISPRPITVPRTAVMAAQRRTRGLGRNCLRGGAGVLGTGVPATFSGWRIL